jgi:hypothetical protein
MYPPKQRMLLKTNMSSEMEKIVLKITLPEIKMTSYFPKVFTLKAHTNEVRTTRGFML